LRATTLRLDGFAAFFHNRGMDLFDLCIFLCIFLGISSVLLSLRWFIGPPDPRDDDGTPWG
jgi:hypothetical protein